MDSALKLLPVASAGDPLKARSEKFMSYTPADAPYPLSVANAHIIRTDAEAIDVAHKVAAFLLEGDAERDRLRQVPAEVVDRNGEPKTLKQPYVDPKLCNGCGACVFACPIKGSPAI